MERRNLRQSTAPRIVLNRTGTLRRATVESCTALAVSDILPTVSGAKGRLRLKSPAFAE